MMIETVCVCVLKREAEETHKQSGSFYVRVVNVTLMSDTLAQDGSVPCQCVMSPNEGELPVPLCTGLSPLMSF